MWEASLPGCECWGSFLDNFFCLLTHYIGVSKMTETFVDY